MFSNMEISDNFDSSVAIDNEFLDELKNYNKRSKINYMSKDSYRNRINKLYNDVGNIKPIDNEINGVIYFDDYVENGVVLNKKNISLKQIWTEYRLIYNEKREEEDKIMENSFVLDNFDDLYDKISKKVDGLDKYIDDLTSLKKEIDVDNNKLNFSREQLELERISFENYCNEERMRLEAKEKELNNKLEKINNLMKLFEEKVNLIGDTNE